MATSFALAFDYMVKNEGGFVNSKFDGGGCTKYGITMATLSRARHCPVTPIDVGNLGLDEAKKIYLMFYWTPFLMDQIIDQNIANCVFDIAVLRGPGTSTGYAQKSANTCNSQQIVVDFKMGPATIAAINTSQRAQFIPAFIGLLKSDLTTIVNDNSSQKIFLSGWFVRADRLQTLV